MKIKIICILVISLSFVQFSLGTTYYVDASQGNDQNNGLTPESAWRTISKLGNSWNMINPGDDILLKRGETFTDARLDIKKGGLQTNYLIIGAYGNGAKPIIDCQLNSLRAGIRLSTPNLSYIKIQDLHIKNAVSASGISIGADNLSNIIISGCTVESPDYNGIVLIKVDTYIIEDCVITNCGNSGIAIIGTSTYPITNGIIRDNIVHDIETNDGITLHKGGDGADIGPNHQILNNVCYNCYENGFDITSGSYIVLRGNESYNNGDSSILVGGCRDVWIDKFYSHDEQKIGIIIGGVRNVKLTSSIIYNAQYHQLTIGGKTGCKNFKAYNNTIIHGRNSKNSIIDIFSFGSQKLIFKNNIITSIQFNKSKKFIRYLGGITPENTKSYFSHNIWWRPDAGFYNNKFWYDEKRGAFTFNDWQSIFKRDKFIDPKLIDPEKGKFSINSCSPCIDTGIDVKLKSDFEGTKIPQGFGPDIGAYEYKININKKKRIIKKS